MEKHYGDTSGLKARKTPSLWGFTGPTRTYSGEASYEKIAAVWPRLSESTLCLAPKHSRMKFRVHWNGAILASGRPNYDPKFANHIPDPFQEDMYQYAPYQMWIEFAGGCPPYFETRDIDQVRQRLYQGYLPALESAWRYNTLEYQTFFFSTLTEGRRVETGNERPLGLARVRVTNRDTKPQTAFLWIHLNSEASSRWENGVVLDDRGRIRLILKSQDGIDTVFFEQYSPDVDIDNPWWKILADSGRLRHLIRATMQLMPSESAEFYLTIPYFPVERTQECIMVGLDFKTSLDTVLVDWESELDRGMRINVPERQVNEIFNAALVPFFVTPDKIPSTGMVHQTLQAACHYMLALTNYNNIPAQDQRGYHNEVEQYLEPWLVWQGSEKPSDVMDNFKTKEGCFMIASNLGGYQWIRKNGWTLAGICNHFKYTRNREWLDRVLPNILASCDWINRERNATKILEANGERPLAYGLLPGGLASDWWAAQFGEKHDNWIASDAFNYMGLQTAADVLSDIGHSRAAEICLEAEDYRECIRTAVLKATERAVKITYPDGSLAPWVPDELHRQAFPNDAGRVYACGEHGAWDIWLMYLDVGPMTLVPTGVFDAREDIITWVLKFEEEYPLKLFYPSLAYPHPMLVHGTSPMLSQAQYSLDAFFWRDEIDKYVEGVYGVLAGHLTRTTYIATDHPFFYAGGWMQQLINGIASQLIRRMLVQESGNELWLAWATPRAWLENGKRITVKNAATYFGPMSYEIISHTGKDFIEATIDPPRRNPPPGMQIKFRLRHPTGKPIRSVTLNGNSVGNFGADTLTILPDGKETLKMVAHF
jgi:hypothetical protein